MEESLLVNQNNNNIIISFIINFNLEDVEGSGDGEKINNQLTVSSNDVGESAAECQGVLHLNVAP